MLGLLRGARNPRSSMSSSSGEIVRRGRICARGGRDDVDMAAGSALHDRGSTFVAVAAFPVGDEVAARSVLQCLREDAAVVSAHARVCAFRASDGAEGSDDDGEARAGRQLLTALRKMKVTGVAICVGRWWNGNIGKARFTHIRERATTLLMALGVERCGGDMSQARWASAGAGKMLGGQSNKLPESPLAAGSSSSRARGGGKRKGKLKRKRAEEEEEEEEARLVKEQRRALMANAALRRMSGGSGSGGSSSSHNHSEKVMYVTNNESGGSSSTATDADEADEADKADEEVIDLSQGKDDDENELAIEELATLGGLTVAQATTLFNRYGENLQKSKTALLEQILKGSL